MRFNLERKVKICLVEGPVTLGLNKNDRGGKLPKMAVPLKLLF